MLNAGHSWYFKMEVLSGLVDIAFILNQGALQEMVLQIVFVCYMFLLYRNTISEYTLTIAVPSKMTHNLIKVAK